MAGHGTARHKNASFRDVRHLLEEHLRPKPVYICSRTIFTTRRPTRAVVYSLIVDELATQPGAGETSSANQYTEQKPPTSPEHEEAEDP